MTTRRRALISVSDKTGVLDLARSLTAFGIEILSTGGTSNMLRSSGIPVVEIGAYTDFPEMLDGRVKTLHPKVHAGILARRDLPEHMRAIDAAAIPTIDFVIVNLYPFVDTVARSDCTLEEAIENIDIGGPTMVRAAAKNYQHVAVITDPADYPRLIQEMNAEGSLSLATRFELACKAFSHTAAYDGRSAITSLRWSRMGAATCSRNGSISTLPNPRICATAKIRTNERPSTAISGQYRERSPTIVSCRAKNCPTTIWPTPMRAGNASRRSSARRA